MSDVFARVLQHMVSQMTVDEKAQRVKDNRKARHDRNQADPKWRENENARKKARRQAAGSGQIRGSYKVKPTGEMK